MYIRLKINTPSLNRWREKNAAFWPAVSDVDKILSRYYVYRF